MRSSFYFTYVLLLTTGTITLVEALRTKDPRVRHIMNIETCISIVAAYFYNEFVKLTKEKPVFSTNDFDRLSMLRYTDWSITTPLMLLGLSLVLAHHHRQGRRVTLWYFLLVLALNYIMLYAGFVGEEKQLQRSGQARKRACALLGFLSFTGLFAAVYAYLVHASGSRVNQVTFWLFSGMWSVYGVVYLLQDETLKNKCYNVLDLLSKCIVGMLFWAYFTKVIVVC
jgi:bacteriorhodopsin